MGNVLSVDVHTVSGLRGFIANTIEFEKKSRNVVRVLGFHVDDTIALKELLTELYQSMPEGSTILFDIHGFGMAIYDVLKDESIDIFPFSCNSQTNHVIAINANDTLNNLLEVTFDIGNSIGKKDFMSLSYARQLIRQISNFEISQKPCTCFLQLSRKDDDVGVELAMAYFAGKAYLGNKLVKHNAW